MFHVELDLSKSNELNTSPYSHYTISLRPYPSNGLNVENHKLLIINVSCRTNPQSLTQPLVTRTFAPKFYPWTFKAY